MAYGHEVRSVGEVYVGGLQEVLAGERLFLCGVFFSVVGG